MASGGAGAGSGARPPGGAPSLVGAIASVRAEADAAGVLGSFLVEDGTDARGAVLDARVTVPAGVPVLRVRPDGGWALASFDDLADGVVVHVWFEGPTAMSYPVQTVAAGVVIAP